MSLFNALSKEEVDDIIKRTPYSINEIRPRDETPLIHACKNERQEVAIALIDHGCNTNGAIQIASEKGLGMVVKKLLDSGVDVNDINNIKMFTPLICAAKFGWIDIIDILISRGANIDYIAKPPYSNGTTAMHLACEYRQIDVVNKLISLGCKLQFSYENDECCELIHDLGSGRDFTRPDIAGIRILDTLILNGCSVNPDRPKHSYLINPTIRKNVELVKKMVDYGAELPFFEKGNHNPFDWAIENHCDELIQYYISLGFDINKIGNTKRRSLSLEKIFYRYERLETLVRNGFNPYIYEEDGTRPMGDDGYLHEDTKRRLEEYMETLGITYPK